MSESDISKHTPKPITLGEGKTGLRVTASVLVLVGIVMIAVGG
jgi:hypothetical protein